MIQIDEALLADLTDPDPCDYDHHGYCQAHCWFETEPVCPHARAKAVLAAVPVAPPNPLDVKCPACLADIGEMCFLLISGELTEPHRARVQRVDAS